jgi:hypothetical protein
MLLTGKNQFLWLETKMWLEGTVLSSTKKQGSKVI